MPVSSAVRERFSPLESPDFRNLWLGQIISAAGSQMQFAALNWQIYDITHSPVALGAIGLVRVIPILLFSLLGGTAADAYDRRRLLLITQSILTVVAFTLSLLAHFHAITAGSIYILTAIGAAAVAFDNPARQALIPSLVPREKLPAAFAINSTGFQVSTIAGPVLAGFILARFGATWAYAANSLSFLAVIVALLNLHFRPEPTIRTSAPPVWESLKEGIHFVRSTPILVATMTLDFWATFFSSATALLPIFARDILKVGPLGFGWLSAFPAIGSLVAGILMSLLPAVRRQGVVLLWAVVVYGLATIAFGFSTSFSLSALFLAGTGAADTVSTVLRQTIRQLVTPDRLRGRMVSVNMIFFMGGPQLGELEAGLVAKWLGAALSVVTGGAGCLITAGVVGGVSPWLRHYELEKHEKDEDKP